MTTNLLATIILKELYCYTVYVETENTSKYLFFFFCGVIRIFKESVLPCHFYSFISRCSHGLLKPLLTTTGVYEKPYLLYLHSFK